MATSESTRARRFALPDLDDERTGESIEAFLEGPDVRRGRRLPRPTSAAPARADEHRAPALNRAAALHRPPVDLRTLPGRLEWNQALDREGVRAARYGRPAAVAIVDLKAERPGQSVDPWLRTLVGPIARVLRQDSRATDLVARVASARFHILLPETSEAGAEHLAQRVALACRTVIETAGIPVGVRISVAATDLDGSLHDALAHALRTIEAA